MHLLDLSAVLFLAGASAIGFASGFVRPFRIFGTLFLAILAVVFLTPILAGVLANNGKPPPLYAIISPVFIVSLVVIAVTFGVIRRQFWANVSDETRNLLASLRWLNRLVGAAVAAGFAFVFLSSIVYFFDLAGGARSRAHLRGSELLRVSRDHAPAWAGKLATKKDFDEFRQAFLREGAKSGSPAPANPNEKKSDSK